MTLQRVRRRFAGSVLMLVLLAFSGNLCAADRNGSDQESFDYFLNNWNVVGLKDYLHGTRVTPQNELWLSQKTAIQVRFGENLAPLTRRHGKLALEGWMPIMLVTAMDGSVRYEFTYWATPLPDVKDWKKAFGWPVEGENYLNWIAVRATNTGSEEAVARVHIGPNREVAIPQHPEEQRETNSDAPHAREYDWTWTLGSGASAEGIARYTFFPIDEETRYDQADAKLWLERTHDYWWTIMQGAAHIEVPCAKATRALLAAHVCQLIANDHGEVHGGENFYDVFYIRDGAYQVMELDEASFTEEAARAVEVYLKCQRSDGRFESQTNQFDANGQAVWTLWQHYLITADRDFLQRAYPQMLAAVRWTQRARRAATEDTPFHGLLPAAPADGECLWDGTHHIVGYDLWNLRAILCTAHAARVLGEKEEQQELQAEARDYRAALDAACERTQLEHFPPSWEKRGTHWGNTETLWPTELFPRNDPRVAALVQHVRHDFAGGFIEGTIQWKGTGNVEAIHPYMGAYTTMVDLVRGRHEQVVEDFFWYLLHSTAANAFPEGIYYKKREAWGNTIPHVTGACNYAIMLRHMLVHEAGDELWLLSAVPDGWLAEGKVIRIEKLPTHFGPLDLLVQGDAAGVRVSLSPPRRSPPGRIVLHLPESRPLVSALENVDVVMRNDQTVRWDFARALDEYRTEQRRQGYQENLTTNKPVTCSFALPGHPAELANDGFAGDTWQFWATDIQEHPEAWWQVDLEQATPVGRIVVIAFYGDQRYYGFTVETSRDGRVWETVSEQCDNQSLSTADGYTCRFASRPVRYIRVTQTANSANTGRHLVEVRAYAQ